MIRQLGRYLIRLVPGDWRRVAAMCAELRLIGPKQVVILVSLGVTAIFTEAFGLFMLLPILRFIEGGGDIAKLSANSELWSRISTVFAWVGLPVTLFVLCAIVFTLICLRQVVQYAFTMYMARLRVRIVKAFRLRTFRATLEGRAGYLEDLGSGNFIQLILTLCHFSGTAIESLAKIGMVILSFLVYGIGLFVVAPLTMLVVTVVVILLGYSVRHFRLLAERLNKQLIAARDNFIQYLSERYRAWRLIKLSDAGRSEAEVFSKFVRRVGGLVLGIARAGARVQLVLSPIAALVVLTGLYLSVQYLKLSVAEITLFVLIYLRLMPLLNTVLSGRQHLASVSASLASAIDRLKAAVAAKELDTGNQTFTGIKEAVTFEDVSFRYDGGNIPALTGVTLSLPAGKLIAITGPSGAGKSTLIDILPRIVLPTSGRVLVDGVDLREFTLSSLRRGIAFVPQTPLLFRDTVLENIRYGSPDATMAEVEEACRLALVDKFIGDLPNGYETVVGESGTKISGGQRQRLTLARAFLTRSSLLIMDEPTSSLDYRSERHIHDAVDAYRKKYGATVLVIGHRISTIRQADYLVILKDGRVVELGEPGALMKSSEWFHEILEYEGTARG